MLKQRVITALILLAVTIGVLAWVFVTFRSVFRVRPSCSSPWLAAFSMLLLWVSLF